RGQSGEQKRHPQERGEPFQGPFGRSSGQEERRRLRLRGNRGAFGSPEVVIFQTRERIAVRSRVSFFRPWRWRVSTGKRPGLTAPRRRRSVGARLRRGKRRWPRRR